MSREMKMVDNVLVVPPFDCAWLSGEELVFGLPGRGCVSFEARTDNDVTVVFKELAGCKHYRTDADPNYTVVIGSHRNRRLKIAANGATVSDVPWPDVLSPLLFERYWVNVDNGLIVVGKGDPAAGQGSGYHCWQDAQPNRRVQFVGLSSWDRHVAYRDIKVLPPLPPSSSFFSSCFFSSRPQQQQQQQQQQQESSHNWLFGLGEFLESSDLSDLMFVVGPECRRVPAHRTLLATASSVEMFRDTQVVLLPDTEYQVVRAALEYMYTGMTEVQASLLGQLRDFACQFGFRTLLLQLKVVGETTDATTTVAVGSSTNRLDGQVLRRLLETGEFSDVELFLEDYDMSLQLHRLVLGSCSAPFAKMFTSGMKESDSRAQVVVKDVDLDAFMAMIRFMYSGWVDLEQDEDSDVGSLLLSLLSLADRYGMPLLLQECHDRLLLEYINKDSAAAILLVASSTPGCERLRTACEHFCAKHFDYVVTPPATEFKVLGAQTVEDILQRWDLVVTSEERVLNAIIQWGTKADTWEEAHQMLLEAEESTEQVVFHSREQHMSKLFSFVRFPFMSSALLQQLASSVLCRHFPVLEQLIAEANQFCSSSGDDKEPVHAPLAHGRLVSLCKSSLRFTRRPSSFKELLYICDGDCNGVLYYAGTSYGQHPWMNPVLIKQITLSASSPPSRYTDPRVLVSRKYQATSYAGPCVEAGGNQVSWWKVDLGAEHELMCNYYSIRQDGSTNFLRSWTFQGSWDGKHWTDLRRHKDDQSICRAGQFASWPVQGPGAFISFRQFRVLLEQPTTCSAAPWDLSICYLELYGYLR